MDRIIFNELAMKKLPGNFLAARAHVIYRVGWKPVPTIFQTLPIVGRKNVSNKSLSAFELKLRYYEFRKTSSYTPLDTFFKSLQETVKLFESTNVKLDWKMFMVYCCKTCRTKDKGKRKVKTKKKTTLSFFVFRTISFASSKLKCLLI